MFHNAIYPLRNIQTNKIKTNKPCIIYLLSKCLLSLCIMSESTEGGWGVLAASQAEELLTGSLLALAIWKTKIVLLTLVSLDTENRNKVCSEPLPTTSLTSPMSKPTAFQQKKQLETSPLNSYLTYSFYTDCSQLKTSSYVQMENRKQ